MNNKPIHLILLISLSLTGLSACHFLEKDKDKKTSAKSNEENAAKDPGGEDLHPYKLSGELQSFASCQEAEDFIENSIIDDLKRQLDRQIGYLEKSKNGVFYEESFNTNEAASPTSMESAIDGAGAAADDSASKSAPSDYTTTNNQVAGVEEADFVKNNGTHIFQIAGNTLNIIKSWPANEMNVVATLDFEDRPFKLLLPDDKRLVVLMYENISIKGSPISNQSSSSEAMAMPYYYGGGNAVKVAVVDISDPTKPGVASSYRLFGQFNSARGKGASIRIVSTSSFYYPNGYAWPAVGDAVVGGAPEPAIDQAFAMRGSYYVQKSNEERIAELKKQFEENVEKIKQKTLEEWLLTGYFVKNDKDDQPLIEINDCSQMHAPTAPAPLGLTRVATINIDEDSFEETLVFAQSNQIYASQEKLYLSTNYVWFDQEKMDTDYTYIHQFDITNPAKTFYQGSGGIPGHILNQFSMDEHEGFLRVASTVNKREEAENQQNGVVSMRTRRYNQVFVLGLVENVLELKGQTEELAEGERIYSARFDGNRGFVVTFRQVDPLFTIDLSDPENPTVKGELKIPGFSTYIHMLDDNHLLTVGREADLDGRARGLKISIFDISDMENPKEAVEPLVLSQGLWSEATDDHKAFTYYRSRKLLAIPVTGRDNTASGAWWSQYHSGVFLFDIDSEAGIKQRGELDMSGLYQQEQPDYYSWSYAAKPRRSIFADDVIYGISNLGIKAANINELDSVIGSVSFDCKASCFNY